MLAKTAMPDYPTLMELRQAGWSLEEIAATYCVTSVAVWKALQAGHLHRGNQRKPPAPDRHIQDR
ncbi:hypothetical protein ACX8Z9_13960 [Arthrobacter halodurans]|uniref:Uncharacterized protein n=1 Tax=Arthrobacter halodurans TaxID=516699 RepID=A0ABV4UTW9_9MICC